jgi:hypothetical protein
MRLALDGVRHLAGGPADVPVPSETATQRSRQRGAATSMLELSVSILSPRALAGFDGWLPALHVRHVVAASGLTRKNPSTSISVPVNLCTFGPPSIGDPIDLQQAGAGGLRLQARVCRAALIRGNAVVSYPSPPPS